MCFYGDDHFLDHYLYHYLGHYLYHYLDHYSDWLPAFASPFYCLTKKTQHKKCKNKAATNINYFEESKH